MTLDEMLQVGNKLKGKRLGANGRPRPLMHIRAIVDENQIVYRTWSARKGWQYHIDSRYGFQLMFEGGDLILVK